MKPMQIAMALLSAVMFFILAGVFMGVQLELNGTKLVVDTAADIRWQWIFIGTAVVFFFQLLRPLFQKAVKNVSGPKFIMPAIDGSTVKQKLFLIALHLSDTLLKCLCHLVLCKVVLLVKSLKYVIESLLVFCTRISFLIFHALNFFNLILNVYGILNSRHNIIYISSKIYIKAFTCLCINL